MSRYCPARMPNDKWKRFQLRSEHHPFQVTWSSWTISSWTFEHYQLLVSCAEPFSLVVTLNYSSFLFVQCGSISKLGGGGVGIAWNLFHLLWSVPLKFLWMARANCKQIKPAQHSSKSHAEPFSFVFFDSIELTFLPWQYLGQPT